jgi:hypothetical protein
MYFQLPSLRHTYSGQKLLFSAYRRKKISLLLVFWQGLWVPGGINHAAKNNSVLRALHAIV